MLANKDSHRIYWTMMRQSVIADHLSSSRVDTNVGRKKKVSEKN